MTFDSKHFFHFLKENEELITFLKECCADGWLLLSDNDIENQTASESTFQKIASYTDQFQRYFSKQFADPMRLLCGEEMYVLSYFSIAINTNENSGVIGIQKIDNNFDRGGLLNKEIPVLTTQTALWKWNVRTKELHVDENWAQILGYTLDELAPMSLKTWYRLIHPEDRERNIRQMNEHLDGGSNWYESEVRLRHKNGHWIWIFDRGQIVSWTIKGEPEWIYGSHYDITVRKQTELKAQHHFRLLEETNVVAKIGTWEIDLTSNQPVWSNYTCFIHGVEPGYQASLTEAFGFFKEGEHRLLVEQHFDNAFRNGIPYDIHVIIVTKQGEEKWVRLVGIPEFQKNNCVSLYGMIQDIDQQKRQSIQLQESEEKFKQIFDYSSSGLATLDTNGNWLQVNKRLCEILGYSEKEFNTTTCQEITHLDDLKDTYADRLRLLSGETDSFTSEKRYMHKDGHSVWCILSVSIIRSNTNDPDFFIAQITPIDDLKNAEKQIESTLAGLQSTLNAATQVSIIRCNCEGLIEQFNKGAENLLGYTSDEVVGKTTPIIFYDEDEVVARGNELTLELGRPISGFNVFIEKTKNGQYEDREWTYIRKDGVRFPVQLVVTRILGENGEITGYLGIATDISRLKTIEYEIQNLLAVTNDQNNRLSNFAHIVSHNLRSHSGNFSLILDLLDLEQDESKKQQVFEMLRTASNNLSEAILHLNEVANLTTSTDEERKPVPLRTAVEQALNNVQMELNAVNATVSNTLDDQVSVLAIPAYIDSILLNILTNAIKYRSKERPLEITISVVKVEAYTEILISDNGLGIDLKRYGSKIFGMYKTFHGNEDARGIGLFITKNQMDAMSGKIEVESTPNIGSTFKLIFYEKN